MPTLSGSLDITGSINTTGSFNISGSINSNGSPVITNAQTGSFITTGSNSMNGNQTISGSMTVTGSLTVSGSGTFTNIGPAVFSGSVTVVNGGVTGSLLGTASYATIGVSSSVVNTQGIGTGTWYPLVKSSSSTGYYIPGASSAFSLDFNSNTLTVTASRAAAIHATGSNPASPSTGSLYYNPSTNLLYIYNGTAWRSSSFA